ncbi:hypothetical protein FRB95_008907 [Tulasnella sp. JGI-2019a]|nr:hypothetical protein FRB95_008907 [Tulasnella sp. JGI-2019a]
MPKPNKSSASSGTRKKHAKRAEKDQEDSQLAGPVQPKPKGKKVDRKSLKVEAAQLKKKAYKAPVKPTAPRPDPLDAMGIAAQLPPDLLVVMRRFGKKDTVTKRRALEELLTDWVDKAVAGGEEREDMVGSIVLIIPVWLHHYPTLALHHSRRIRLLTASVHAALLSLKSIRSSLFHNLNEISETPIVEHVLGAWAFSAFDPDSTTASKARQSWDKHTALSSLTKSSDTDERLGLELHMPSLLTFLDRAILQPASVYAWLNPPAPEAPPAPLPRRQPGRPVTQTGKPKETEERSKSDAEEEHESDRNARYRIGGMGLLKWLLDTLPCNEQDMITTTKQDEEAADVEEQPSTISSLASLLSDPLLWSVIYHGSQPPWVAEDDVALRGSGFGDAQPGLRRSAWTVLDSLARKWLGYSQIDTNLLSTVMLRSAWVEPDSGVRSAMWEPLLLLLTELPLAWLHSVGDDPSQPREGATASATDINEDDEEGSEHTENDESIEVRGRNIAYEEFLDFLKLGCGGSPRQGYPAVLIITSTLPPTVLTLDKEGLNRFFVSFWAAVDGRALGSLERSQNSAAFLSSLLECLILILKRLTKSASQPSSATDGEGSKPGLANATVLDQFEEICTALLTGRLKTKPEVAGEEVAKALTRLESFDQGLLGVAWSTVSSKLLGALFDSETSDTLLKLSSTDILDFAASIYRKVENSTLAKQNIEGFINDVIGKSLGTLEGITEHVSSNIHTNLDATAALLSLTIVRFGSVIWENLPLRQRLDTLLLKMMGDLLTKLEPASSLGVLAACLPHTTQRIDIWQQLLECLGSAALSSENKTDILKSLLDEADSQRLPTDLKARGGELDALLQQMVDAALDTAKVTDGDVVKRIISHSSLFVSEAVTDLIVGHLVAIATRSVQEILRNAGVSMSPLEASLSIMEYVSSQQRKHSHKSTIDIALLPSLYLLVDILSAIEDQDVSPMTCVTFAKMIWTNWSANCDEPSRLIVMKKSTEAVKGLLGDVTVRIKASEIIERALVRGSSKAPLLPDLSIDDILPDQSVYDWEYSHCDVGYVDKPMVLLDPEYREPDYGTTHPSRYTYDEHGYSKYGRLVSALAMGVSFDRQSALDHIWVIRHLVLLASTAQDHGQMGAVGDAFFGPSYGLTDANKLAEMVGPILAYTTSHVARELNSGWHAELCTRLKTGKGGLPSSEASFANLVEQLYTASIATETDGIRDTLVLRWILTSLFRSADLSPIDTEHWLQLGGSIRLKSPQTSLSIILVVGRLGIQSPKLDRYRNELASHLSGVPPSKANRVGLRLLRQFIAATPKSDSDIELLPQQRAIFLLQALQKWVASDEELDEEIESLMAHLFLHLAPIVQSVPGAHWDLIFDVIETNLENSSLRDLTSLTTITRAIQLVTKVEDLASSNQTLRETWTSRQTAILKLIADRLMERVDDLPRVQRRLDVRKVVLFAAKDLPIPIPIEEGVSALCHLLKDASMEDQASAYQLISRAVVIRNERLVVEAAVDTEDSFHCTIPPKLLEILPLDVSPNANDAEVEERTLAFLLGWLVLFDLFVDASLKVKNNYLEELRNLEVLRTAFFPSILYLLDITRTGKPFNLDAWEVQEFDVQKLDDSLPTRLQVLSAHVYYRSLLAIPSLVRSWLQDCKDRQVVTTLTSYTTNYFSPVISAYELAPLRTPEAIEELSDEHVKIKVASAANEVTATYIVDDQPMEILVKLPADFPLHTIEVREVKKLGIPETKWKAWLFNVIQVSQNGTILEALSLWKRNVALHFEGKVECAICYSIISVMDQTLPTKPCRTCKNRFHAGCLFKWFNTSSSSSCPLCRSDIQF